MVNRKPTPDSIDIKTNTLAPVQRATLEFVRNFISDHGYAPTLKDIATHIGVKSLSTAHFHLERLEQKGFITRGEDGFFQLTESTLRPELGPTAVPLLGVIAAGIPMDAIETPSTVEIPSHMIPSKGEVFCLEVSGESMIDFHVCNGDVVVVKKQDYANDGDVVVALLETGEATLKTYRRLRNGDVVLIPANTSMVPIRLKEGTVSVQGKMVGLFRTLH